MGDWTDSHADNLAVRSASALALIAVGLSSVIIGGPALAAATAAAAVAMSFEWARMSEPQTAPTGFAIGGAAAFTAVCAAAWGALAVAGAVVVLGALVSMVRLRPASKGAVAAFGIAYVAAPCVGFIWLRTTPDGLALLLSMFAIVWASDSAAYFAGRFIGGPRLAPSLSPKKTWSGLVAGVTAATAAGLALGQYHQGPWAAWAAVGATLGAVGLAGDLFESLCKRHFGVKDASSLIPGHGGVLDRLDSLLAVTTATLAVILAAPDAPAILFARTM
ncbi:MAG: phosphatidate cytidylyltransferase [Caulobacterales bacterium]|jgi:phosphatidate cytidylyltransferase